MGLTIWYLSDMDCFLHILGDAGFTAPFWTRRGYKMSPHIKSKALVLAIPASLLAPVW